MAVIKITNLLKSFPMVAIDSHTPVFQSFKHISNTNQKMN